MKILGPTPVRRLNEVVGLVTLAAAVYLILVLVSFHPQDASWNTAAPGGEARNLGGHVGAYFADLLLQIFGLAAFLLPALMVALSWKWVHSAEIEDQWIRTGGGVLLFVALSATLGFWSDWRLFDSTISLGGLIGSMLAGLLLHWFNLTGSVLVTSTCLLVSLYLLTTFSLRSLPTWLTRPAWIFSGFKMRWSAWLMASQERREAEREAKAAARAEALARQDQPEEPALARRRLEVATGPEAGEFEIPIRTYDFTAASEDEPVEASPGLAAMSAAAGAGSATAADLPWEPGVRPAPAPVAPAPTRYARSKPEPPPVFHEPAVVEYTPPEPAATPARPAAAAAAVADRTRMSAHYQFPPTTYLNEPEARSAHDTAELKEIAVSIKGKFEEFNVLGSVTQINPGPVVTTFEFKPEAGIKYSRITTLSEDLCLGLQAESILIERIPGKPTVGIEVPNSRREVISLRQILESEEFQNSPSKLTIAMGKDISGRIKVASLETMPHLLIAGSTGSGKSVMLNSLIMSVLFKSSPEDVRMILIDPKRVEMGPYEDIPHLLTPVITDPRKATIALRNAVLEMERRLKLLASQGVRNIEQFNKKVKLAMAQPRSLFADDDTPETVELQPLPFILIVIDELADLMMLERGGWRNPSRAWRRWRARWACIWWWPRNAPAWT